MEEVEPLAVRAAIHINLRQALVFLADFGQILLAQGVFAFRVGHNRLDADLVKALIRQMKHVVAEILVKAGKRAADVVFLVTGIAAADELLRLVHDDVIAALAVDGRAHPVMHFAAAVDGDDDVAHFLVQEVHDFVIHQHTVRRHCELEVLILLLLDGAAVFHQPLDDGEVHQRFAAEEVQFQIDALAGVRHQPVNRRLADLVGQQLALAHAEVARRREAVLAAQVAVMRRVQAHGFHHARLGHLLHVIIIIRGVERAEFFELL